jgi:hypothetical protein
MQFALKQQFFIKLLKEEISMTLYYLSPGYVMHIEQAMRPSIVLLKLMTSS